MAESFDAVVVGAGVVGASTAFHLAKWGAGRICVVDRGPVCAGGTAKSCAIVRSHYSVPSNTALAVDSIAIFENFAEWLGDGDAQSGFTNTGYLIVVPEGEFAEKLKNNLVMQAGTGANTYPVSADEARERHPLLDLNGIAVIGYEPESGYADPYLTTMSFINAARRLGVTVKTDCAVDGLLSNGAKVTGVRTNTGDIHAGTVVSAIGPWTRGLTDSIGLEIPLEVSRHIVLTFRGPAPYESTLPVVKDLATGNKMYFRPASGGDVLVGTGDHGDPVSGPDAMDENVPADFVALQGGQLARRMPSFAD